MSRFPLAGFSFLQGLVGQTREESITRNVVSSIWFWRFAESAGNAADRRRPTNAPEVLQELSRSALPGGAPPEPSRFVRTRSKGAASVAAEPNDIMRAMAAIRPSCCDGPPSGKILLMRKTALHDARYQRLARATNWVAPSSEPPRLSVEGGKS